VCVPGAAIVSRSTGQPAKAVRRYRGRRVEERLAIAGSGTIACGLAAVAARSGEVIVLARSTESAARAREQIAALSGPADDAAGHDTVLVTSDVEDASGATYVVEAVAEDPSVKAAVIGALAETCGPDTVLATTTSSLSVAELGAACSISERFAGLHVFNPVPKMRLIEVAFPDQATERTRERTLALCLALRKKAVVVPDIPGFVVNRLLFPYLFSAVDLLEETGLDAAAVDRCMTLGAGHPMGPLELLDLVGLDVAAAIGEALERPAPARIHALMAEGALGRKSGRGFHAYSEAGRRARTA
jgi:3-hydroxybutyryl-CoA dehydrogenase